MSRPVVFLVKQVEIPQLPYLEGLTAKFEYTNYHIIREEKDLTHFPIEDDVILVEGIPSLDEATLICTRKREESNGRKIWSLASSTRDISHITYRSLTPGPGRSVIFVLREGSPWVNQLDALAARFSYRRYYIHTVDEKSPPLTSNIYDLLLLPENLDIIFITADENIHLPVRLAPLSSHWYFQMRRGWSLIPCEPEKKEAGPGSGYHLHGDLHYHILSFLPVRDAAVASRTNRSWRNAARTAPNWAVWQHKCQGISPKEFIALGNTPYEAYIEVKVRELIDKLREGKSVDLPSFPVSLPIFGRVYAAAITPITTTVQQNALTNLLCFFGRTASLDDILEFHRLMMSDPISTHPYSEVDSKALSQWLTLNPRSRCIAQFIEEYKGSVYYDGLRGIWNGLVSRPDGLRSVRAFLDTEMGAVATRKQLESYLLSISTLGLLC